MTNLQTIGKYEIIQELGRGGFATVYQARDTDLGRPVALKVLYPHWSSDPAAATRFLREARLSARLRHHYIVTVYEAGEVNGRYYLAMAYLPGRTLRDLLETEGALPLERARPILEQMAQALDYAHAQGMVHRDVKPANIMVEATVQGVQATLTDFGLVKALGEGSSLTATGVTVGSPEYMAPEQADPNRAAEVGLAADRYALGIVAYHMLTGRVPFPGNTPATLYAHEHKPVPPPQTLRADLPAEVAAALLKMLAKAPSERYPTAAAFVAALRPALPPQTDKPAPNRPTWLWLAAAGLVIAACLVGLGLREVGGFLLATPTPTLPIEITEPIIAASTPTETPLPPTSTATEPPLAPASGEKPLFVVINKGADQQYFIDLQNSFIETATGAGAEAKKFDAKLDPNLGVSLVNDAISAGAKGIAITVPDQTIGPAIAQAAKEAKVAKVVLIATDDGIQDADGKPVPFVGFDGKDMGKKVGEAAADLLTKSEWLKDSAKKVGVLSVEVQTLSVCNDRTDNEKAAIIAAGVPKDQVFPVPYTGEALSAQDAAGPVITANPDITHWVVFGCNDEGVLGTLNALATAGVSTDNIIGVGLGSYEACKPWAAEQPSGFKAGLFISGLDVGNTAATVLYDAVVNGKEPPASSYAPTSIVDASNFKEVMDPISLANCGK